MYYRFRNGIFIKADTFEQAKLKLIMQIFEDVGQPEDPKRWSPCTCTGFDHRHDCPEKAKSPIPF